MAEVAKRPPFRAMWQSNRTKIMHGGFRQYMNTFMENIPHAEYRPPVSVIHPQAHVPTVRPAEPEA